jgi:hypothetical protein
MDTRRPQTPRMWSAKIAHAVGEENGDGDERRTSSHILLAPATDVADYCLRMTLAPA